jgi:hypothetical protein
VQRREPGVLPLHDPLRSPVPRAAEGPRRRDRCPPLDRRPLHPSRRVVHEKPPARCGDIGSHRHRHAGPLTLGRTREECGLLTGRNRGPNLATSGDFHLHGQARSLSSRKQPPLDKHWTRARTAGSSIAAQQPPAEYPHHRPLCTSLLVDHARAAAHSSDTVQLVLRSSSLQTSTPFYSSRLRSNTAARRNSCIQDRKWHRVRLGP